MLLSLYHDQPESESCFSRFGSASVLAGLKALDSRARRKGLRALDPSRGALIPIGMEVQRGRVVKNGYGVFNLAWQAEQHPEWADQIAGEVEEIRAEIRRAHGARIQFQIWICTSDCAEDKAMYQAAALMRRGPRCYLLDSTDPEKLRAILADMQRRSGLDERGFWPRTLVVAMGVGATCSEPAVNLQRIAARFRAARVDASANIRCMAAPGSSLERFASDQGHHRVPLQLDGVNSVAGCHSGPLTRGSLYPLALGGIDLRVWIGGAILSPEEIHTAWRLASFLHVQAASGRDKVTLLLPRAWEGAGPWTRRDFEQGLAKVVTGERIRLTNYYPPRDPRQDRVFWVVQLKGSASGYADKLGLLRRSGYPVASLALPAATPLSRYMQMVHYAAFGMAWLRKVSFVPSTRDESIPGRLLAESAGKTKDWRARVTLRWDRLNTLVDPAGVTAPVFYASILKELSAERKIEYGELTFFGDMRYSPAGRSIRAILDRAAEIVFRAGLKIPADVGEGRGEMNIGNGKYFSTVLIAGSGEDRQAPFLAERGRAVSITLRGLDDASLGALDEFFRQAARHLKARR